MKSLSCVFASAVCSVSMTVQDPRAPFEAAWVAFPDNTSIVATGDLDADGDVDAVGWYFQDTNYARAVVRTYLNDGLGNFSVAPGSRILTQGRYSPWDLRVGTIDGVAGEDWIAAFEDEVVTSTGLQWTEPTNVTALRLLDYDDDGDDDLAVLGGELRLFENTGAAFVLRDSVVVGAAEDLDVAELDGLGGADLVCSSRTGLELGRCPRPRRVDSDRDQPQ